MTVGDPVTTSSDGATRSGVIAKVLRFGCGTQYEIATSEGTYRAYPGYVVTP